MHILIINRHLFFLKSASIGMMLSLGIMIVIRSLLSKLVPGDELGKNLTFNKRPNGNFI